MLIPARRQSSFTGVSALRLSLDRDDLLIGLDVHKRAISYRMKDHRGSEGSLPATHYDLDRWMNTLPHPWSAAMEEPMFSGWIYDHLKTHVAALKVVGRFGSARGAANRKAALRVGVWESIPIVPFRRASMN